MNHQKGLMNLGTTSRLLACSVQHRPTMLLTTKAGFSIQLKTWLLYIFARFRAHFTSRPFHPGNSLNFHTLLGHCPTHGLGGRHTYTCIIFQLFQLRQTLFQLMQPLTVINRKRKLPTTPRKVTHRPLFYHKSTNPRLQQAETQLSHNAGLL